MNTVLIVDDDPILQMTLTRRLEAQGFKVISATSGQEALDLLSNQPADVVVSDVMMPGMNGFEFCHHLRSSPAGEMVPFIFLSSLGELTNRVQGHMLGADDYLVKPFSAQELIAKVRGAIARSQRLHSTLERLLDQSALQPPPLPLTPAEERVFWEVVQGFTNKQIGEHLFLSPRTVQTHLSNMLAKLNLENRSQIVRFAFERGYRMPEELERS
ncbi:MULTISPECIES: response regulator transcription factor [Cyanophyceae]|uniref:response regulator transcription factor n=1 Tax=Cyanophyceae TaxID=3028117 RepID=UPI0016884AED|nr:MULTISPECIES: response regulator transcription factor [Cyanophyceae]MBD1916700.1 response regulator transcription factor [Phormidium sp. FACHB-77]MBD2031770.1 response regulator transcription factor [Phormidium sp. FACHB-322]MBD2050520.1 response regulator transcription factor [Leptolyngbya sp. FACHB-60]